MCDLRWKGPTKSCLWLFPVNTNVGCSVRFNSGLGRSEDFIQGSISSSNQMGWMAFLPNTIDGPSRSQDCFSPIKNANQGLLHTIMLIDTSISTSSLLLLQLLLISSVSSFLSKFGKNHKIVLFSPCLHGKTAFFWRPLLIFVRWWESYVANTRANLSYTKSHTKHGCSLFESKSQKLDALILDRCWGFDDKDHYAVDRKRNRIRNREGFKSFKQETNLPGFVTCVPGARFMHINNQYISQSISNGSCGFIVDVGESGLPEGLCIPGLGRVKDPYELNKMSTPYLLTASHNSAII